jgi:hypothetical protein
LTQSDPTDHALAAIASILDQPASPREPENVVEKIAAPAMQEQHVQEPTLHEPRLHEPRRQEAEGYQKTGPGPMEAIRFKWTVRRDDNGDYYVDETIGENSRPVISGPMWKDEAIKFVDDRELDARRRFEELKSEMTGRAATAHLVRNDGGEL